jgi:putative endonuclease
MSDRQTTFDAASNRIDQGYVTSTKAHLPVILKAYLAVETEANARQLERDFKTGSGKAFANKRFWRTAAH